MKLTPRQRKQKEARAVKRASAPNSHLQFKHKHKIPPGLHLFTEEDHLFWVVHGLNYLISDLETATWSPLFEEIYVGTLPAPESLYPRVMAHFNLDLEDEDAEEKLTPAGVAAFYWMAQDKAILFTYSKVIEDAVSKAYPGCEARVEARLPKRQAVWETFDKFRDILVPTR